jgi:hypothetical protein
MTTDTGFEITASKAEPPLKVSLVSSDQSQPKGGSEPKKFFTNSLPIRTL